VVLRVVFFFLVLLVSSAAHAGKRVALVIGNSGYRYASELTNPKNDAIDVTAALERNGFIVISGLDSTKPAWIKKFASSNGPCGALKWVCFSTPGMACKWRGKTTSYPPMPNCRAQRHLNRK
jgi:hypothetical protein